MTTKKALTILVVDDDGDTLTFREDSPDQLEVFTPAYSSVFVSKSDAAELGASLIEWSES